MAKQDWLQWCERRIPMLGGEGESAVVQLSIGRIRQALMKLCGALAEADTGGISDEMIGHLFLKLVLREPLRPALECNHYDF